jgi:hypothetical protein
MQFFDIFLNSQRDKKGLSIFPFSRIHKILRLLSLRVKKAELLIHACSLSYFAIEVQTF